LFIIIIIWKYTVVVIAASDSCLSLCWNATAAAAAAAAAAGVKTDKTCCTAVCEEPERVWERPRAIERDGTRDGQEAVT